ncbi:MAG: hypothetical protein JOY80_01160 [Candidatus Dormibacteraeota bacterium]|nr:hypothetical protein [Candidatus Dormibacteraeota bacterium]
MRRRRGRHSRTAVLERDFAEVGSRAADTIAELAEHALAVAREIGQHASPALQHSAEGLSRALERAGESLAESGERLARGGEHQAAAAAVNAREHLADASEKLADAIRPKKKHHRVRNAAIALVVVGGVVALVQSPLRAKLTQRLFGPPPDDDDEPESITLPGAGVPAEEPTTPQQYSTTPPPPPQEGNGVPSTPAGAVDSTES